MPAVSSRVTFGGAMSRCYKRRMPTQSFPELKEIVLDAAEGLPGVEAKRLFGCDGFFARGTIFSLIWKTGRIGIKLLDEADYAALMKVKGSSPWSPGPAKPKMFGWILVGPSMNDAN